MLLLFFFFLECSLPLSVRAVWLHFPQCRRNDARSRRSVGGNHDSLSAQLHAWNFSHRLLLLKTVEPEGWNDCESEQHEARQLTFATQTPGLFEIFIPATAATAQGCQTTSIIQCQPAVATGAVGRLVPASLTAHSCFNLKVASQTTHRGELSVCDVICATVVGHILAFFCCCWVGVAVCEANMKSKCSWKTL